jgi:hypothetical protein
MLKTLWPLNFPIVILFLNFECQGITGIRVNKRFAIVISAILVSGLAIMGYFLHQGRKSLFTDPFKLISPEAAIVIETDDVRNLINSVTTGKGLFSEIDKVKEFTSFSTKLKYIADQINKPGFTKFLQEGRVLVAFYPTENGKPDLFVSAAVPAESSLRQLREGLASCGIKDIREVRIGRKRLFEIPYLTGGSTDTVFMALSSGLLVTSTSGTVIRKAFFQPSEGGDIRSTPGFSRILFSAGKKEDKIYVVFENLAKIIRPWLKPGEAMLAEKIGGLGKCAEGDVYISEDGLSVSGYTDSSDPSDYLSRFIDIEPGEFQTYKILPASTSLFETVVFDPATIKTPPGAGDLQDIVNLALKLKPYLGRELTRAIIDIKNRPVNENELVIYELKNRVESEKVLHTVLDNKIITSYFQPDDQTSIPVYYTSNSGLIRVLSPGFAPNLSDRYFTFFDKFLITGSSYETISRILYDNLLNKTLSNDMLYRAFEKTLASRAGYLFYCVPSQITGYLAGYLNENIISGLTRNENSLNKLQSLGFQLSSINNMIYHSFSASYKEEVIRESITEWETLLDTVAAIKPVFFTNHNTGAKEIFIQDLKNNAYLINAAGRVLWKVPLNERITGTIYMIDYYRNGKYQLLFSGRNNLHLLDRNGNYVERYPVRLRSPATNSLALFDYDNNKTYRIVIAGEDKMIYSYDKSGSVVKGWKPFRTAGIVKSEVDYYRISGKDYIVACDESSVYFLDRYGNIRLKLNEPVTRARGSSLRLNSGSNPCLVCSSPDGTVQNIYFNGDVRKFSLRRFSPEHTFDFFDVDGDGSGDYIFIDEGTLYLYGSDRKEIFKRDFGSRELGGPIMFVFSSSDRKIGVFDSDKNLIYLISSKGDVMKGFPLRGASMFSIGKITSRNNWNLIVGGMNRFLYNYKLETSFNQ